MPPPHGERQSAASSAPDETEAKGKSKMAGAAPLETAEPRSDKEFVTSAAARWVSRETGTDGGSVAPAIAPPATAPPVSAPSIAPPTMPAGNERETSAVTEDLNTEDLNSEDLFLEELPTSFKKSLSMVDASLEPEGAAAASAPAECSDKVSFS